MTEGELLAFVATLARAAALVASAPVIGDRSTPAIVKAVVAAALATAGMANRSPLAADQLAAVLPLEVMLGLVAGLSARVLLAGVDVGGQLIGLQMGIGIAGQLDPNTGDEALPTRRITAAIVGLAFIGLGGLDAVVRVIAAAPPHPLTLVDAALELPARAGEALVLGARIAAPLLLAGTACTIAIALASRSAPSVNVFAVDLALRAAVALAVLIACGPSLIADTTMAARRAIDVLGSFTS